MYKKVGINDVDDFYKDKFSFLVNYDFTDCALNFFDINNYKYLWILSKVTEGSKVLDFGCGSGTLSCLKQKECEITGIDLSESALRIAKDINNYDKVFKGDIFEFNHQLNYFDFIVSLDVFGHIPFEDKNKIIQQLKRYLKTDGVMLHGIECGRINYDSMPPEELEKFIKVDGHVGIEDKSSNIKRFSQYFNNVRAEVRYDVVNSYEEYMKQIEKYNTYFSEDLYLFLKTFDVNEKKIFNYANGLAMIKMEEMPVPSLDESGGFLFLECSDAPLMRNNFYKPKVLGDIKLENKNVFLKGWFDIEKSDRGFFRWSSKRAFLKIQGMALKKLIFSLFTSYPMVKQKSVSVFVIDFFKKEVIKKLELKSNEPLPTEVFIHEDNFIIEIFVETTWIPNLLIENNDDRELGIGLEDLDIL